MLIKLKVRNKSASIFLLAIWTVLFLSVFALYTGRRAQQRIDFVKRLEDRGKLRLIAHSGVNNAMAKVLYEIKKEEPFLFSRVVKPGLRKISESDLIIKYNYSLKIDDGSALCSVVDEESKLNLNSARTEYIENLLTTVAKISKSQAESIAQSIVDWRDNDNERKEEDFYSNEDLYYQAEGLSYSPKNADFEVLEEILLVSHITPEVFADIRPFITIFGRGKVNLLTASEEVLVSLGLNEAFARKIIDIRKEISVTAEENSDIPSSVENFISKLEELDAVEESDKQVLQALSNEGQICFDSESFSLISYGRLPYVRQKCSVYCIIDKEGNIKYWKEEFRS